MMAWLKDLQCVHELEAIRGRWGAHTLAVWMHSSDLPCCSDLLTARTNAVDGTGVVVSDVPR